VLQTQLLLLFQFADKFAEFKEAARLAKEKSQEKMELTSTPSQVTNTDYNCTAVILASYYFTRKYRSSCQTWNQVMDNILNESSTAG